MPAILLRYRLTLLVIPLTAAVAIQADPEVGWDYLRAFLIAAAAMLAVTALRRAFGVPLPGDRRARERRAVNRWGAVSYALLLAAIIVRLCFYLGEPAHFESLVLGSSGIGAGIIAYFREGRQGQGA